MIKTGASHSLLGLLLLLYSKQLLATAEQMLALVHQTLAHALPAEFLLWLGAYPTQLALLVLSAFCWGVLHHYFCHEQERST